VGKIVKNNLHPSIKTRVVNEENSTRFKFEEGVSRIIIEGAPVSDKFSRMITRAMDNSPGFFDRVDTTIVESLVQTASKQLRLKVPSRAAGLEASADRFRHKVVLEKRMMALLPFHISLWQLLQTEPSKIKDKDLKSIVKDAKIRLNENPDDFKSWRVLASAYAFLGEMKESEDTLRIALQRDREFMEGWYMMGALLYGLDRLEDASKCLGQANELDSENDLLRNFYTHVSTWALMFGKK
jgi:tetratricopeptide (TPR) repeat protein